MAENETTIKITGVDNTAPAVKSAIGNVEDLTERYRTLNDGMKVSLRNLESMVAKSHGRYKSIEDVVANIEKGNAKRRKEAADAAQANAKKHADAQGEIVKGANATTSALTGMVTRYLSVAAVVETVRRSFVRSADWGEGMRTLRLQTGSTLAQMDKFNEVIIRTGRRTGDALDELRDVFATIGSRANLTADQVGEFFEDVVLSAKASGTPVKAFGVLLADAMRAGNIPASEARATANMLNFALTKLNLSAEQIGTSFGDLSEQFKSLGYSGTKGLADIIAMMGVAKETSADTEEAMGKVKALLGSIGNEKVAMRLEFPSGEAMTQWARKVVKGGGELVPALLKRIFESPNKGKIIKDLGFQNEEFLKKLDEYFTGAMAKRVKDLREGALEDAAAQGQRELANNARASINKIINELDLLTIAFGDLLQAMGGIDFLTRLRQEFMDYTRYINNLKALYQRIFEGKPLPEDWPKTFGEFMHGNFGGYGDKVPDDPSVPLPIRPGRRPMSEARERITRRRGTWSQTPETWEERQKRLGLDREGNPLPGRQSPAPPPPPTSVPQLEGSDGRRHSRQLQKNSEALEEGTKKLIAFSSALPDSEEVRVWKASVGVPGYGGRAVSAAYGKLVGPGGSTSTPTGSHVRPGEGAQYGGSGDSRVLKASYDPNVGPYGPAGSGYGGGGGPGSPGGGIGPGGRGSDYGGGTRLAPPRGPGGPQTSLPPPGDTPPAGPPGAPPGPLPEGYGGLVDPVTGTLGGGLGDYRSGGGGHAHQGVDLLTKGPGQPIFASGAGTIIKHSPRGSYQKDAVTTIRLDDGRTVKYMHHQLDPNLKVGDRLRAGQPIGKSGVAAGVPHLHYEMRDPSGRLMDPIREHQWSRGRGGRTPTGGQASEPGAAQKQREAAPPPTDAPPTTAATPPTTGGDTSAAPPGQSEAFAAARAAAVKAGIPDPDTAAAIAMYESGNFKRGTGSVFDKSGGTNPFGQTVPAGTPGAVKGRDGQWHASYGSLDEGFEAHFKRWGHHYKGGTPEETLASMRRAGYNKENPRWLSDIAAIRRRQANRAVAGPAGPKLPDAAAWERARKEADAASAPAPRGNVRILDGDKPAGGVRQLDPASPAPGGDIDKPVNINFKVNDAQVQFARTSMARMADREVREARWNSYSDIGAA